MKAYQVMLAIFLVGYWPAAFIGILWLVDRLVIPMP